MRTTVVALLVSLALLAACGGGDDDDSDDITPTGPPLSDKEYVQQLCSGIQTWVDATYTKSTEDELREVVDRFVRDMKAVSPPADVRSYHADFIKYLESAREEPTLLITTDPPLPDAPLRARLAMAEQQAACVAPLFTRETATPTPGR